MTPQKPLLVAFLAALAAVLVLGVLAAPRAGADEPAGAPGAPPAAEETRRAERLAAELGAPDFEAREAASRELLEMGEAARPVLERTMRESENLEARWRAEQILRRMDRQGERRIDEPRGTEPRPAPVGPPGIDLDELMRRLDERLFRGQGFGFPGEEPVRLEAPGLVLEVRAFGLLTSVKLTVTDAGATPGGARDYYGRTLEEVLRRNPDLQRLPGMADLQAEWQAHKREAGLISPFEEWDRWLERARGLGGGITLGTSGRSVEISQDGDRVRVKVTERGEDGQAKTTEVEGASLEEIKRAHPELADVLSGFRVSFRVGAPQFVPPGPGGVVPLPPAPPVTPSEPAGVSFGVRIAPPDPVVAAQLRLEPGQGAQVHAVLPGSQAEALGLQPYDVIVQIEGSTARTVDEFVARLRQAAQDGGPLTLTVLRGGARIQLRR